MSDDNDRLKNLLLLWPERAMEYLYEDYYDSLIRISERKTHSHKAAEDIVQEAFAYIWENRHRLIQNNKLYMVPLLFTIVKNRSINHYKKNLWLSESKAKFLNGLQSTIYQPNDSEPTSLQEAKPIWHIIATFPKKERECITLKHQHNMSNDEIAKHLKISKKAVERSVTSAYKRLRKYEPNELRKSAF